MDIVFPDRLELCFKHLEYVSVVMENALNEVIKHDSDLLTQNGRFFQSFQGILGLGKKKVQENPGPAYLMSHLSSVN